MVGIHRDAGLSERNVQQLAATACIVNSSENGRLFLHGAYISVPSYRNAIRRKKFHETKCISEAR